MKPLELPLTEPGSAVAVPPPIPVGPVASALVVPVVPTLELVAVGV